MAALHALGPDYQSTFSPLESDAALEAAPAAAAAVVDGRDALGPRLLLSYNAQVPCPCMSLQLRHAQLHHALVSQEIHISLLPCDKNGACWKGQSMRSGCADYCVTCEALTKLSAAAVKT